jgi:hypothetical protein
MCTLAVRIFHYVQTHN